ncbi:MAG TPA: dihydropteroate synthase, partial [Candidatus Margulisbacteria bacterium]|nr:dihydropteroate synthase [Candidatus Margulisiibacteriota bacterium]HCY37494.1 dihydropteroate synthase [Candidatus Margulisiibacteriota bacterium]
KLWGFFLSFQICYNFPMKNLAIIKKFVNNEEIIEALRLLGSDTHGIKIMAPKFRHHVIKITNISTTAALIIKQEMLSKGGEVATPRNMITHTINEGDIMIAGTSNQYKELIRKLRAQPFGLKNIAEELESLTGEDRLHPIVIGKKTFDFNVQSYLMGILNVTPDSFSDGGQYYSAEDALRKAKQLINEEADIIDIGGQSTRPGAESIQIEEEIKRVLPVIKAIRTISTIPISIDTFHSRVAHTALQEGADMVNDISGLRFDPEMAAVVKKHNCPVALMHTQGMPLTMQKNPTYSNIIQEIIEYLEDSIKLAIETGIDKSKIIIDPGIGFGKNINHNLSILHNLGELKTLKCPILVGTSRKSFIGKILGDPVDERILGTAVTNVIALNNGANIIRVHDVKEMKKVITMSESIKYYKGGSYCD